MKVHTDKWKLLMKREKQAQKRFLAEFIDGFGGNNLLDFEKCACHNQEKMEYIAQSKEVGQLK